MSEISLLIKDSVCVINFILLVGMDLGTREVAMGGKKQGKNVITTVCNTIMNGMKLLMGGLADFIHCNCPHMGHIADKLFTPMASTVHFGYLGSANEDRRARDLLWVKSQYVAIGIIWGLWNVIEILGAWDRLTSMCL